MPVAASDMIWLLSGGASNTDKAASLGGIVSSTQVAFSPIMNNLFDNVAGPEAIAGDTEYRCIYLKNAHASAAVDAVTVWISSNTPSSSSIVAIAADPAGIGNGVSPGMAATPSPLDENTAPPGVNFALSPLPTTEGTGIVIGQLDAQEMIAIWFRRTISALAPAAATDPITVNISGAPL